MVYKAGLICVYQGDDWAGQITLLNCDGTQMDLTGYNVNAQIRQGPADQSWRIAACFTTAILLPNIVTLSLTHRQTTCLRNPSYCWDCQIVSPDGIVTTVVNGTVSVTPEVTREPRYWRRDEIDAFLAVWYGADVVESQMGLAEMGFHEPHWRMRQ